MNFTKETGPKPSKQAFKEASQLVRENTGDHVVIAMAMRPNGVTQHEVIAVLGHPHRNIIKKLLDKRTVKQMVLPDGARSQRIRLVRRQA